MAKTKTKPKGKIGRKRVKRLTATPKIKAAAKKSAALAARGAPIRKLSGIAKKATPRKDDDRIVLYGLQASVPTCKVGLLLRLSGVAFDYRHVDLRAGAHKQPDFLAKNRYAQVPVLEHRGYFICQANVILAYLAETFGKFAGRTPAEKLRIAEWLAWDLDRMASGVGLTRTFTRFMPQDPAVVNFTRQRGEQALDFLDRHLGASKFLASSTPSIADIAVFAWIAIAGEGGFEIARWPNVGAWAARMMALQGAAHPYEILPLEDRRQVR